MPWLVPIAVAGAVAAGVGVTGAAVTAGIGAATGAGKVKGTADPYGNMDSKNFQLGNEGQFLYAKAADAQNRYQDPYTQQQQRALVAQLQEQAAGRGPSAAQGVLRQGTDESIRTAMALAGSSRGAGLGGAQLNAVNAGSQATLGAANQATILRAQEQQAATQNLGSVLGGMRQSDIADQARKDQLEEFYMSQGLSREQAALQAKMQMEQLKYGAWNDQQNRQLQREGINAGADARMFGAIGGAFSSFGAMGGNMMAQGAGPKPPSGWGGAPGSWQGSGGNR